MNFNEFKQLNCFSDAGACLSAVVSSPLLYSMHH
eukprot:SAG31_NODE_24323_length_484_cov_0.896104_2_plen_33_part_01